MTAQDVLMEELKVWELQLEDLFETRRHRKEVFSNIDWYEEMQESLQIVRSLRRCIKFLNELENKKAAY